MANIDLNTLFSKRTVTTSPVDTDIQLNKPVTDDIVYSDIKLDLIVDEYNNQSVNSLKTTSDLKKLINEECILTSLKNIMMTTINSRLLNPEINFDLREYLFDNLSETKAYFMGRKICDIIPIYEPRVEVESVHITVYYNYDTYGININLSIPSSKKNIKLNAILNGDGFFFN